MNNVVANNSGSPRELRRAVAALLENSIEDVEFIWNSLSRDERAQLRPLIEAASGINEKASALVARPEHVGIASNDRIEHIIALMEHMPAAMTMRLFASLDAQAQCAAGAKLQAPLCEQTALFARSNALTDRTRAVWLELCLEHAASLEPAAHEFDPIARATRVPLFFRALRHMRGLAQSRIKRHA
ncbi:hypothetical protein AWB80_04385 [Caballeronia pedi]|uniref:Uncharacterized protein n=1 Tax=Caballeronia pedi TaxID=1777141 RepID=A0A158C0T4_9BURK|nr:hypothetical protein [Caballeronia pedi]SAK75860.1 hypothetical protein AWB80_04385 [Caballeronia pedi]